MKKLLVGIYILVTAGILIMLTHGLGNNKDHKEIAAGEKIYKQQCAACHGDTGKGEGAKPGTSIHNSQFLSALSDKDIFNNIKYGREGTQMPAYKDRLSDRELKNIIAMIRSWQDQQIKFETPEKISGDTANGARLYKLYCLSCHGEAGSGKQQMGTALGNPQYLKYTTDKQIWIGTANGREETRMGPSLKGLDGVRQLKKQEISDIVTYIKSLQQH